MKTYNLNIKIEIPDKEAETEIDFYSQYGKETIKEIIEDIINFYSKEITIKVTESQEENLLNEIDKLKSDINDLIFNNSDDDIILDEDKLREALDEDENDDN